MKLVLAGSKTAYQLFINKLWSKDKNVSEYRYISSAYVMRGYSPNQHTIVKLGSFSQHPEAGDILEQLEAAGFNMNPRRVREAGMLYLPDAGNEITFVNGSSWTVPETGYYNMICTPRGTVVRITDGD